jgi:hypothetical protein
MSEVPQRLALTADWHIFSEPNAGNRPLEQFTTPRPHRPTYCRRVDRAATQYDLAAGC